MRRAARVDNNHTQVVAALRSVGIGAYSLAGVGKGCPDLIAGFRGVNVLLEVKDGEKCEGHRKLTAAEAEFIATWPGLVYVVTSPEEAVRVVVEAARPRAAQAQDAAPGKAAKGEYTQVLPITEVEHG